MKRLFLSFLTTIFCIPAFCQYKFTLKVKTKTLADTKIRLEIYNNHNFLPVRVDSFIFVNNHHQITGEVKQPSNFATLFVSYKGVNTSSRFVLDSGNNTLTIDTPILKDTKSLTLRSDTRGNLIFSDLNNLFLETIANYKEPTRVNGYLRIPPELDKQLRQVQLKRLQLYPKDFCSLIYLYRISRSDALPSSAKDNLSTLSTFSDELRNSELGRQLYIEQTNLINNKIAARAGNTVPIFTIADMYNRSFSNSSLKGQPYMIVFSATWCGPCQRQLPRLKKLYKIYNQKGLKVIYFNDDDDVSRWKEHISKNKLTWINVSEKLKPSLSKIPKSFGVYSIPTCLVINKKGVIIYNSDELDPAINHVEDFIKKAVDN